MRTQDLWALQVYATSFHMFSYNFRVQNLFFNKIWVIINVHKGLNTWTELNLKIQNVEGFPSK